VNALIVCQGRTVATEVLSNFVNGEYVAAAAGQASPVVDPSTGEEYAQAPVSGPADVEAALRAAAGAFEGWRDTTPAERSRALLRMADATAARAGEIGFDRMPAAGLIECRPRV
jgi:betaine-aldehyde dehydrogenase